jgi:hypothetical protein
MRNASSSLEQTIKAFFLLTPEGDGRNVSSNLLMRRGSSFCWANNGARRVALKSKKKKMRPWD